MWYRINLFQVLTHLTLEPPERATAGYTSPPRATAGTVSRRCTDVYRDETLHESGERCSKLRGKYSQRVDDLVASSPATLSP